MRGAGVALGWSAGHREELPGVRLTPELSKRVRRHSLGGDQRAGSYARGLARRRQRDFIRRAWMHLALFALWIAGVLGVTVALTPSSFMRGLIVGLGVAGTAGALWLWIVEATGTAPTMMGDLGEQWTAKELRRLRRSGWQVVNHVTLTAPDIDHVLVGPGGMFAIETKWSATTWTVDDPRIRSAAESACRNARLLGLWQNLKPAHVGQVRPVVFLWGAGAGELPESFEVAGATVVPGHAAKAWRQQLGAGLLAAEQIQAAWSALDAHCRKRDQVEQGLYPLPLSLWEWAIRVVLALTAACAGLLTATWVPKVTASGLGMALGWGLLLGLGVLAARIRPARFLAMAWVAGVAVVLVLVAGLLLVDLVSAL